MIIDILGLGYLMFTVNKRERKGRERERAYVYERERYVREGERERERDMLIVAAYNTCSNFNFTCKTKKFLLRT